MATPLRINLNGLGIDNKLRQTTSGSASYFVSDHLGTTRGLSDVSGNLSGSIGYDSFGNSTSGSVSTRYTFTGREADSDTGLYYYRARWYDPQQGRFITEDPIGLRGGLNLYTYANQNPVTFSDPDGTFPVGALVVSGAIVVEWGIHYYLFNRANSLYSGTSDPVGRKRHCYVNCMSTRIHLGNPIMATSFSVAQEVPTLVQGAFSGHLRREIRDTVGDLAANHLGQIFAFAIWRNCKELCDQCPSF